MHGFIGTNKKEDKIPCPHDLYSLYFHFLDVPINKSDSTENRHHTLYSIANEIPYFQ